VAAIVAWDKITTPLLIACSFTFTPLRFLLLYLSGLKSLWSAAHLNEAGGAAAEGEGDLLHTAQLTF